MSPGERSTNSTSEDRGMSASLKLRVCLKLRYWYTRLTSWPCSITKRWPCLRACYPKRKARKTQNLQQVDQKKKTHWSLITKNLCPSNATYLHKMRMLIKASNTSLAVPDNYCYQI